jgi:hypothetical protein
MSKVKQIAEKNGYRYTEAYKSELLIKEVDGLRYVLSGDDPDVLPESPKSEFILSIFVTPSDPDDDEGPSGLGEEISQGSFSSLEDAIEAAGMAREVAAGS